MARNMKNFDLVGSMSYEGKDKYGLYTGKKYLMLHKSGRWCILNKKFSNGKTFEHFDWLTFESAKKLAQTGAFKSCMNRT